MNAEPCAADAVPPVLALGAGVVGGAVRRLHDGEVDAEGVAGRADRGMDERHRFRQLVGVHEAHGLRLQHPLAGQFAAVQQHLAEAHVVHGRGEQPAAAGQQLRRLKGRRRRHRRELAAGLAVQRRKAVRLLLRHEERGVLHAKRLEHPLAQHLVERLAGEHFHQVALHIHAHAVLPLGARLRPKRDVRQLADHLAQGGVVVEDVRPPIALIHRRLGKEAVGEAGGVADEFADRHLVTSLFDQQFAVLFAHRHLQPFQFGDELAHRVVQIETAFVKERHERDAGDGLGHGVDAEDAVLRKRRVAGEVLLANRLEVDELAAPRHRGHRAGQFAIRHQLGHGGAQGVHALGIETHRRRLGHRQVAAFGGGVGGVGGKGGRADQRGQQKNGTKRETRPQSARLLRRHIDLQERRWRRP